MPPQATTSWGRPEVRFVRFYKSANIQRVDRAFKDFFRRCKTGEKPGYPRFRKRSRYKTIEINDVRQNQVQHQRGRHADQGRPLLRFLQREIARLQPADCGPVLLFGGKRLAGAERCAFPAADVDPDAFPVFVSFIGSWSYTRLTVQPQARRVMRIAFGLVAGSGSSGLIRMVGSPFSRASTRRCRAMT